VISDRLRTDEGEEIEATRRALSWLKSDDLVEEGEWLRRRPGRGFG
jgi:hypothetical protein